MSKKFWLEFAQLLGAIAVVIGAWIISRGLAIMIIGALVTAIGTLVERGMLNGSGSDSSAED